MTIRRRSRTFPESVGALALLALLAVGGGPGAVSSRADGVFGIFGGGKSGGETESGAAKSGDAGTTEAEKDRAAAYRAYAEAALIGEENDEARRAALDRAVEEAPQLDFLRVRAATAHIDAGRFDEAMEHIQALYQRDPNHWEGHRLEARIAVKRQDFEGAATQYEKALETNPGSVEALQFLVEHSAQRRHDYPKAKELADRLLSADSRNLYALVYRAEAMLNLGDPQGAAESFQRALRLNPGLAPILDQLAQSLMKSGHRREAFVLYRAGLLTLPDSPILQRGFDTTAGDGDASSTLAAWRELTENAPFRSSLLRTYAGRLLESNRLDEAAAVYRRVLEGIPGDVDSLVALGNISARQNRFDDALSYYLRATEARAPQADPYLNAARLLLQRNEVDRAGDLLRRAAVVAPRNANVLLFLADVSERKKDFAATEDYMKQALEAAPANPAILSMMAGFYLRQNRTEDTVSTLEQLAVARPDDFQVQAQLIQLYMMLGRDVSAQQQVQRGRLATGGNAEYDMLLAQGAATQDDQGLAEESALRAYRALPENLSLRFLIARVYLSLGEGDKAVRYLTASRDLAKAPDEKRSLSLMLAAAHLELRRWSDALKAYARLAETDPDDRNSYLGQLECLKHLPEERGRIEQIVKAAQEHLAEIDQIGLAFVKAQAAAVGGDPQQGAKELRALAAKRRKDSDVAFQLALLESESRNFAEAEAGFLRTIKLDPDNATAHNNLAYLYAQQNRNLDDAEALARRALQLRPGAGFILDTIGWIAYRRGDYETALRFIDEARRRSGNDPELFEHLGEVYAAQGNTSAALYYLEKAATVDAKARERIDQRVKELKAGGATAATPEATPAAGKAAPEKPKATPANSRQKPGGAKSSR